MDRQGCQARNSKKNNKNVTQTRAFQLKSAVCWAVLWFLRNFGLVSCPHRPSAMGFAPTGASSGDRLWVLSVLVLAYPG